MRNQISEWWQGSERATMDQLDIRDRPTPGWRVATWRSHAGRMIGSFDFTYLPDCQLLLSFSFLSLDGGCFAIVACLALWRIRLRYGERWISDRSLEWSSSKISVDITFQCFFAVSKWSYPKIFKPFFELGNIYDIPEFSFINVIETWDINTPQHCSYFGCCSRLRSYWFGSSVAFVNNEHESEWSQVNSLIA